MRSQKSSSRANLIKGLVFAVVVADGIGIYAAHQRLTRPVSADESPIDDAQIAAAAGTFAFKPERYEPFQPSTATAPTAAPAQAAAFKPSATPKLAAAPKIIAPPAIVAKAKATQALAMGKKSTTLSVTPQRVARTLPSASTRHSASTLSHAGTVSSFAAAFGTLDTDSTLSTASASLAAPSSAFTMRLVSGSDQSGPVQSIDAPSHTAVTADAPSSTHTLVAVLVAVPEVVSASSAAHDAATPPISVP